MAAPRKKATPTGSLNVELVADRVTKGAVRFMQDTPDFPINVYLRKEQVAELGIEAVEGAVISVTIDAA
jgi:hypothetical protein